MKKIIITIAFTLAGIILGNAQTKNETGIYFGAIVGTQINDFKEHFGVNINPELYAFSIGAGSAWTKNNFVVGLEFLYSNASKNNRQGEIQYVGFSNTVSFGYNISKSKNWKIEPMVGLVLSNNQLIIQNTENQTFQNLVNNQFAGNIGLNVKIINENGLFTGLKMGYATPFAGQTEWKDKVSGTKSGLFDNVGSFYLQLNLGGLLDLSKKN